LTDHTLRASRTIDDEWKALLQKMDALKQTVGRLALGRLLYSQKMMKNKPSPKKHNICQSIFLG
jgi:hypothetical protein